MNGEISITNSVINNLGRGRGEGGSVCSRQAEPFFIVAQVHSLNSKNPPMNAPILMLGQHTPRGVTVNLSSISLFDKLGNVLQPLPRQLRCTINHIPYPIQLER